jgi:phosphate-selective porin OprO/OprP
MRFQLQFVADDTVRALHVTALVLALILAAPRSTAAADNSTTTNAAGGNSAATTNSPQDLRKALEEEKERIRQLEQRLQDAESRAAPPGAASPSAAAGASATSPSTSASAPAAPGSAVAPPVSSTPVITSFGSDGFTLKSVDGANVLRLRGNVSVDGRYFTDSYTPPTADTWLVRRLRPTLEGTLDGRYDFRIMPDFAQGKSIVQDAWAAARVQPWLVLTFGKFKAPMGLERLQLEQFARFIEPSLTADLLPYRDLGFKVGGTFGGGVLSYDLGVFDGVLDSGSTDGNTSPDFNSTGKFTWEGRAFAKPFLDFDADFLRGLGLGVAGSYVNNRGIVTSATTNALLASYKTTGQQPLFSYRSDTLATGPINNATIAQGIERRLAPQFYYYYRSLGLLGEYVQVDQQVQRQVVATSVRHSTLRNDAWQLQASFFLTGEDEGYEKAAPRRELGHGGGLGAWELVARYHAIHFDSAAFDGAANSFANPATAARAAHAVGVGINWYFNRNVKTQLDYEVTHFDGGAASGNRPNEQVLTSQFALIF